MIPLSLFAKESIDPFSHVVDSEPGHHEIHIFDSIHLGIPLPFSKFIVFLTLSAIIVAAAMIWVANKIQSGEPPKGRLWNFLETLIFFVRDKIARPALGDEDGDKYLPFLTSMFLFIFVNNLFGMIPFMPSPTASIYVTGALALVAFLVIHTSGIKENGFAGYLKTFIPHIHLDGPAKIMAPFLIVGMAMLEYMTAFIRAIILAVRLFANMLAGHTVLFMILFFIKLVADPKYQIDAAKGMEWLFYPVSIFSVLMVTALSLLELFIAGLQAFVFTFLTAVFIGLAKHPPH
jgi:F-type H+-transporting ATPase subunit a